MKPHPDPMVRRVLEELYPSPLVLAIRQAAQAFMGVTVALRDALKAAGWQLSTSTTCRLCGCTGSHHDGCLIGPHV